MRFTARLKRSRAVRCFTLTVAGETSEQCTTESGVPVLVRAAGSEIRLLELDTEIDDRVFEPPADPIDG